MRANTQKARRCSRCGSTDHDLRLCPIVHLDPALPVEQRLAFVRRVMKRNQRFSFPSYRRLVKHIQQYVTEDGDNEAKMKVPYQPDVARELYEMVVKSSGNGRRIDDNVSISSSSTKGRSGRRREEERQHREYVDKV